MLNVIDTPHYWYYDGEYRLKKEIVKKFNLTPLEKIVFEILLEAECLTYDNIAEQLPAGKWNSRSIYTALGNLKKKGLVQESGKIKVARTRAILYSVTITKAEYYEASHRIHFDKINDGSVDFVLSALSGYNKKVRSKEIIDEVEDWLKEQKKLLNLDIDNKEDDA